MKLISAFLLVFLLNCVVWASSGDGIQTTLTEIGPGWSKTSVNATIFRKNSIVSANGYQFVAYYDTTATVVLARRKTGASNWEVQTTPYKGNVYDAHNIISIMIDGDGFLHMSWNHHNTALNYCKSKDPFGMIMGGKEIMTGTNELVVSYPEFYRFSNGDLLFAFRDGGSGNGNLVLNRYHIATKQWERLQSNLIDGEGDRNAYWQIHIDSNDQILVSWVWRETPDVASNHDLCFAKSEDGGYTWTNSVGVSCQLPINKQIAEIICHIPQNSNLINQTSMCSDEKGNVYIATYYKGNDDSNTQFHLIYQYNGMWLNSTVTERSTDFNLSGMGTRAVPVSRPQVLVGTFNNEQKVMIIFRDAEWDNYARISTATVPEMKWNTQTMSPFTLGSWEPSFDTELWKSEKKLHLFIQNVGQGQGETTVEIDAQNVGVLELNPVH